MGDQGPPDYVGVALDFAKKVTSGKIVACKKVKQACRRHLDDLKRARKDKAWGYVFDAWHGADVCDYIEKLPHVAGSWDTKTITLEPPQIFILVVIFGWRKRSDGTRRFSTVYIEMARKGAKSTLTSGVALYCLTCENEVGPEIIIGATTGEQAGKVFLPAKKMVERTDDLRAEFGVKAWARSITCETSGGWIQTINSRGRTQDGWNPHLGILDELHAHKDRGLYDVIKSAFGSRKNPLLWIITTAGFDTAGVCYEQRKLVSKILEGTIEADHYFGIIFTLDEGDDPYDERNWPKANPMLGVTPTLESMRSYAIEAKESPESEGEFKTKRLNIWLGAAGAWLNMEKWRSCGNPALSWDDFKGLDCYIGGDLADKDDIAALVMAAFRPDGQLIFKPRFYLPKAILARAEHSQGRHPAPYRAWAEKGFLTLTDGDWIDHRVIEKQVQDWREKFGARRAVFDQFAAAQQMASNLNEGGDPDRPFAGILAKNAKNMTDPAVDLEARVKSGPARLCHDDHPIMNWMASNVVVERRISGTLLPKKESEKSLYKIDGIDALLNATSEMVKVKEPEGKSFLDRIEASTDEEFEAKLRQLLADDE